MKLLRMHGYDISYLTQCLMYDVYQACTEYCNSREHPCHKHYEADIKAVLEMEEDHKRMLLEEYESWNFNNEEEAKYLEYLEDLFLEHEFLMRGEQIIEELLAEQKIKIFV